MANGAAKGTESEAARPSLARFDAAWRRKFGVDLIGGIDEAGRGALAGPVVAACVVLGPGTRLDGVDDSKVLTPEQRAAMVPRIMRRAVDWSVGWATAAEIDRINILQATLLAAQRALACLTTPPPLMLTDYLKVNPCPCPVEPLVDGDARSQAIAAASVLAKVARDRIMCALDREYPVYCLASNKGYGTAVHWSALDAHGPSTLHRLTYQGVTFFSLEPTVRAGCVGRGIEPAARDGFPDFARILANTPEYLDPLDYLPECEYSPPRHQDTKASEWVSGLS